MRILMGEEKEGKEKEHVAIDNEKLSLNNILVYKARVFFVFILFFISIPIIYVFHFKNKLT